MVEIVGYRTVYKNLSYYCGPGPAVVCDGEGRLVVGFRRVLSWLVYGFRFEEGYGVRARVLSAECDEVGEEIVLRDDGAVADLGYPDACLLPDGRVMVVYYTNQRQDAPDSTAPRFIEACFLGEK